MTNKNDKYCNFSRTIMVNNNKISGYGNGSDVRRSRLLN